MRILVVGSNGHLGRRLVRELTAKGHEVTGTSRSTAVKNVVVFDALNCETYSHLPKQIDAVVYNISSFRAGGVPREGSDVSMTSIHKTFADWVKEQRIPKVILMSVIGVDHSDSKVPHFYEKKLMEEAFKGAAPAVISLRPGMFIDQEDQRIEKNLTKGIYQHIGNPNRKYAFTSTQQVCDAVQDALNAVTHGFVAIDVFEQNWSPVEFAKQKSVELNRNIKVQAIPIWLFQTLTFVPRLFNRGLQNLLNMMIFIDEGKFIGTRRP